MGVLAAELVDKNIWYPTILGVLVVVAGVGLFCGSIYLLLGTNLGARLGFLVAFTGLMAFMVLLTTLWMFTASPLNTIKGHIPKWEPKELFTDPSKSQIAEVRDNFKNGRKVDAIEASNVKAAVDENLVKFVPIPTEPKSPNPPKFPRFDAVTDYLTTQTKEFGGSSPSFLNFQFTHKPLYAVVQFCAVKAVTVPFGVKPPDPECDPNSDQNGYIVLERNLGSVRQPPMIAFGSSVILFCLGLLGLHWFEKDRKAARAAAAAAAERPIAAAPAPEPAPEPVNA